MLAPSYTRGRIRLLRCLFDNTKTRPLSEGGNGKRGRNNGNARDAHGLKSKSHPSLPRDKPTEPTGPSLFEQLFPDQRPPSSATASSANNVPRLVAEPVVPDRSVSPTWLPRREAAQLHWSDAKNVVKQSVIQRPAQTSVLLLRNASKNLREEDFRRLIPSGHLEGWSLDNIEITRVIPERDLYTLAPTGSYYVLFSSPLGAFSYQGHALRVQTVAAARTSSSGLTPTALGTRNIDVQEALQMFTLVPATQPMELRLLKPPLAPGIEEFIRCGGYAPLVNRKDRMPFEARLSLDGPQLYASAMRHIFLMSAADRGLSWSGGDDMAPVVTKWTGPSPGEVASTSRRPERSGHRVADTAERKANEMEDEGTRLDDERKRRTATAVYIVGFHTERAMHSFVAFWHRRPMDWPGYRRPVDEDGEDSPPLTNVEVLW